MAFENIGERLIQAGRKTMFVIGGIILFLLALAIFGSVSRYLDERAFKKAQTDEYFRRQAMTPEARIAEDSARAKAQADRQAAETKKRIYDLGVVTCLAKWKSGMKDPDSAVVVEFSGSVDDNGNFDAWIAGRGKNSFGAIVPRRTACQITHTNGVSSVELFDN